MKRRYIGTIILITIAAAMLQAGTVVAGDYYAGAHAGKILLNFEAKKLMNEDLYGGGVILGTDLMTFRKSTIALEADVLLPVSTGTTVLYGSWDLWSAGLYGCLRIGLDAVYIKAKAGLVYEKLTIDSPDGYEQGDLGLSPGLGVGFRPSERLFIEIETVIIDEKMSGLRGVVGLRL